MTVETIITAIITGGLALVGVIISNVSSNHRVEASLEKAQAVTDTKLDELTREVRAHNDFATRIPLVENEIKHMGSEIKTLKGYHTPTN